MICGVGLEGWNAKLLLWLLELLGLSERVKLSGPLGLQDVMSGL